MTTTASFHDVIIASSPRRIDLTACLVMILLLLLGISAAKRGLLCNPSRLREDLLTNQTLLAFSGKLRLFWNRGAIGGFMLLCLGICCSLIRCYEIIEHLEIYLDKLG